MPEDARRQLRARLEAAARHAANPGTGGRGTSGQSR
jgi:hypothetical protein